MATYTIVNDMDGTFRVHRKGCADVDRRRMKNGQWDAEAASVDELVAREVAALNKDIGGFDESYFIILPCVKEAK